MYMVLSNLYKMQECIDLRLRYKPVYDLLERYHNGAVTGGGPQSVRRLTDKLYHDNQQVALAAVFTLGELGEQATPALPSLIMRYLGHSSFVHHVVAHALARIGPPAIEVLLPCLSDPRADVRLQTAHAIEWMGPAARVTTADLMQHLDDPNQAVREAIVNALTRINA